RSSYFWLIGRCLPGGIRLRKSFNFFRHQLLHFYLLLLCYFATLGRPRNRLTFSKPELDFAASTSIEKWQDHVGQSRLLRLNHFSRRCSREKRGHSKFPQDLSIQLGHSKL